MIGAGIPAILAFGGGEPSAANASFTRGPLGATLEPWLVAWILPVGGILSVGVAGWLDKKTQDGPFGGSHRTTRMTSRETRR